MAIPCQEVVEFKQRVSFQNEEPRRGSGVTDHEEPSKYLSASSRHQI
jgi:hypothetical protein